MAITFRTSVNGTKTELLHNGVVVGEINAGGFGFDPAGTGLVATNLQSAVAELDASALGSNQTWQNVTASRSAGVTYTNSTGKPIIVQIVGNVTAGGSMGFRVNGALAFYDTRDTGTVAIVTYIVIPPFSTYSVTDLNNYSLTQWLEYR